MVRMYKFEGGYHNFNESEVDAAIKDGWETVTDDAWQLILKTKNGKFDSSVETATIDAPAPKRMGRPKKVESV